MDTKEPKVSKNRQKKETIVSEISEKIQDAKGIVFTNYQGLTHQQLETFKKQLKPLHAELMVAKNRLVLRALDDKKLPEEEKAKFQQPTATLILHDDVIGPLKALAKSIKELNLPEIKFGIIDGRILAADQVTKLSTLPPLEVLRAQLLGQMQSPIAGLHRALRWNLQNLVLTLNAVKEKKS